MVNRYSALFILLMGVVLLIPFCVAGCGGDCPDEMELSGTLTVVDDETNPPEVESNSSSTESNSNSGETIFDYNEPLTVPGQQVPAAAGEVMYAIDIHFTVISNIAVNVTSDEAGTEVFHTLYWGNVARGGDQLTFTFWVHNIGEEITFHTQVTGDYLTVTPPLDVTLGVGESQQFNMTLDVPYEAPEGDQQYSIELIEGSYM